MANFVSPFHWKMDGTRELQEILQREGIDITLRTIQRDLNQISQRFPIENNGLCLKVGVGVLMLRFKAYRT